MEETRSTDFKRNSTHDETSGDWFEDAESDPDWADKLSLIATDSFVESVCGENRNQQLLNDLLEKNKLLETRWKESENAYENLQSQNENLKLQLASEKQRASKFQKKLRYIEDNQEIFNRLKQAYLNMKYNQSAGRDMVEIRETASQTWEGVLYGTGIDTADVKSERQLEILHSFTKDIPMIVTVKQNDIDEISETVFKLKNMIIQRETTYGLNEERDRKLRDKIRNLENQNRILQELVKGKCSYIQAVPAPPTEAPSNKGCALLRKIIFKQEKRIRELVKYNTNAKFSSSPLNDTEREMVEHIVSKYLKRLGKKCIGHARSMSCDRDANSHTHIPQLCKICSQSNVKKVAGHGDADAGLDDDACMFISDK